MPSSPVEEGKAVDRRQAIKALLARREEQRRQRREARAAERAGLRHEELDGLVGSGPHPEWRTRKELIQPCSYKSIPLLRAGGSVPSEQSLFNECLPSRRSHRRRRPRADDSDEDTKSAGGRSVSPPPARQQPTPAKPETPVAALAPPPPAQPESPRPPPTMHASCQTEKEDEEKQDPPPPTALEPARVEEEAAAVQVEEAAVPSAPVLEERATEGEEEEVQPTQHEAVPAPTNEAKQEEDDEEDTRGRGPRRASATALKSLGPLPLRGRVHVCVNQRADLLEEDDGEDGLMESQVWAMLGGGQLGQTDDGAGGPVVLLSLATEEVEEQVAVDQGLVRPRPYLLVRDIDGPLGEDGFEKVLQDAAGQAAADAEQQQQQRGESPGRRRQAGAAARHEGYEEEGEPEWMRREGERLSQSLAPLVAGVTDLSQQLRCIEDQAQDLEGEMVESRRRLEEVQKQAVKELEAAVQFTMERRRESRALVQSLELTGAAAKAAAQRMRPAPSAAGGGGGGGGGGGQRADSPPAAVTAVHFSGDAQPAWHISPRSPSRQAAGRGLEAAEAELFEARNIMCELEIEVAKILAAGTSQRKPASSKADVLPAELSIGRGASADATMLLSIPRTGSAGVPSTTGRASVRSRSQLHVMRPVSAKGGSTGNYHLVRKAGAGRPGWKL